MSSDNPYKSPAPSDVAAHPQGLQGMQGGLFWVLFSFQGRIPRRVFWGASLLATVVFYMAVFALSVLSSEPPLLVSLATTLFLTLYVLLLWISLALQVKRWHDRDKSGLWIFVSFIPLIGPIVAFVETGCLRGTVGPNRFGQDPTGDMPLPSKAGQLYDFDHRIVQLDGLGVTDEDLAPLIGNINIEELRLGGTGVTDAGLGYLRDLTTLQRLDLSLTKITDAGLASLLALPNLETLWIGGTRVSDAGLIRLAKLPALREIYARNTQITAEGARDFQELRPDCGVDV